MPYDILYTQNLKVTRMTGRKVKPLSILRIKKSSDQIYAKVDQNVTASD